MYINEAGSFILLCNFSENIVLSHSLSFIGMCFRSMVEFISFP